MAKCKHKGCKVQALFKSRFCWKHIQDKEEYKKLILQRGKEANINLSNANLARAHLRKANLRKASLVRAILWEANLSGANLEGADLHLANLGGANLRGANLQGASFLYSNLEGANLTRANLRKASLETASLMMATLERTNLVRAILYEAYLHGANLSGADLQEAILVRANLERAKLIGADLTEASLRRANLERANFRVADLQRASLEGSNLMRANLSKANLGNADLRNATLNNADLSGAVLTGAKIWGMSHAGCKTENIKVEYLNFDKDGNESGIVHLNQEQAEEFFSFQPTIEILLQNKLPPYGIRTLLDLIDKINQQNPDWRVEPRKITSSNFLSELTLNASRDEILEEVANSILGAFNRQYQQRLLEYSPDKAAAKQRGLILKEVRGLKRRIENPVQQVTIIQRSGKIPVNVNFKDIKMRDIKIFGNVAKMINVEGNYYEISAPQGRENLIRNLIDQLDSPEIQNRIGQAEAELKSLPTEQVKFLEKQFKQIAEKIFKEKEKQVRFFDKVKAFSQRFSESAFSGVVGNSIWFAIQRFGLPNM